MTENIGGWTRYEALVLDKLSQNDEAHLALAATLERVHIDLASLKTGARLSGALAGFLAGAITTIVVALIGR